MQATAEVTGGSVDNLKLIGSGKADIAFTQVDTAVDALQRPRSSSPRSCPCARSWSSTPTACTS